MVEDFGDQLFVTAKGRPHLSRHMDPMPGGGGRDKWEGQVRG